MENNISINNYNNSKNNGRSETDDYIDIETGKKRKPKRRKINCLPSLDEKELYIKIYRPFLGLCKDFKGNPSVPAAVISFLKRGYEYNVSMMPENPNKNQIYLGRRQAVSIAEIYNGVMGVGGKNSVNKALKFLEEIGVVSIEKKKNRIYYGSDYWKNKYLFHPKAVEDYLKLWNVMPETERALESVGLAYAVKSCLTDDCAAGMEDFMGYVDNYEPYREDGNYETNDSQDTCCSEPKRRVRKKQNEGFDSFFFKQESSYTEQQEEVALPAPPASIPSVPVIQVPVIAQPVEEEVIEGVVEEEVIEEEVIEEEVVEEVVEEEVIEEEVVEEVVVKEVLTKEQVAKKRAILSLFGTEEQGSNVPVSKKGNTHKSSYLALEEAIEGKSEKDEDSIRKAYNLLKLSNRKLIVKFVAIVDAFNEVTGKKATYHNKENVKLIEKKINDYEVEDFKVIFEYKKFDFTSRNQTQYIRISTMCRDESFQTKLETAREWKKQQDELNNLELSEAGERSFIRMGDMIMEKAPAIHLNRVRTLSKQEFSDLFYDSKEIYGIEVKSGKEVTAILVKYQEKPYLYKQYRNLIDIILLELKRGKEEKIRKANRLAREQGITVAYRAPVNEPIV